MNQEFEEILNRLKVIEEKVAENSDILESIQRRAYIAMIFGALKWFIVIGLTFGVFYYTKPYLEKTIDLYNQVNDLTGTITGQQQQAGSLLNSLKGLIQ